MKKSYLVYSGFLILIVIVMIVTAFISDYRTKKAQVRESAVRTLSAAGATEVDDDYVPGLPSDDELLHGGEAVDLSGIPDLSGSIKELEGEDGEYIFTKVANKLLKGAKFNIVSTKVSGHDAEVKVHIFFEDHQGEIVLEYFYYDGEWILSNTFEALNSLTVEGKDYDSLSESAYEQISKEFVL